MMRVLIFLIIALGVESTSIVAAVDQQQSSSDQVETSNPDAYDAFRKGWEHYRRETPSDFGKAASYFEKAIQLDPNYARAHTALAAVYWNSAWRFWTDPFGHSSSGMLDQSRVYLKRAMHSPSALTHQIASEMEAYFRRKPKTAFAKAERAIALDANDPAGYLAKAHALLKAKKPAEAIASMKQAMQLDPNHPSSYMTRLGRAQFDLGQYAEAAVTLEKSAELNSQDDRAFVYLAAAYGHLGRNSDAVSAVDHLNRLRAVMRWGNLTIEEINRWRWTGDRNRLKEGLTLAGVESGYDWRSRVISLGNRIDIKGVTAIGTEQAKQLHEAGVPFIDMSTIYVQARIPGAHNLRWGRENEMGPREFNEVRLLEIGPKPSEIVIYHPNGSSKRNGGLAAAYAADLGFQNVYYFRDSLGDWKKAGYALETNQ